MKKIQKQLMALAIKLQNQVQRILEKIWTEHYDNTDDEDMETETENIHCHKWDCKSKETMFKFILIEEVCTD